MSRPRKPTALRLVTGGRTRIYHSRNEPKPAPSTPTAPDWLKGRAREAWNSVVDELTAMNVTCRLDSGILASWASATGTIAEAQDMLNKMDPATRLLIKNKRGGPTVNPLVGIIRKSQRDASHFAQLLGLTPSGRASLEVRPLLSADPADKFFAGVK